MSSAVTVEACRKLNDAVDDYRDAVYNEGFIDGGNARANDTAIRVKELCETISRQEEEITTLKTRVKERDERLVRMMNDGLPSGRFYLSFKAYNGETSVVANFHETGHFVTQPMTYQQLMTWAEQCISAAKVAATEIERNARNARNSDGRGESSGSQDGPAINGHR